MLYSLAAFSLASGPPSLPRIVYLSGQSARLVYADSWVRKHQTTGLVRTECKPGLSGFLGAQAPEQTTRLDW